MNTLESTRKNEAGMQRLVDFFHSRTGIKVQPSKKTFLEGRLQKRLDQYGFVSMDQYCHWLFEEGGLHQEEALLIDLATTNKTDFFREIHHFDYLANQVLPLLQERGAGMLAPLRIWSAGCSNGAEPYSLAMVCQEFAQATPGFQFEILASDLCTRVLKEAVRAIYPHADVKPVPLPLRQRYLLRDVQQDEVRIIPELRRQVRFYHHNLMELPYPPNTAVEVLFCRNLLIYFDKPTQREVLFRLCHYVKPGGYLFLGHSETVTGLDLPLQPMAPTAFRRLHDG
ncbi:MAG: protein-glutamate O-methyltransferase CheR [Magnetococcales bacterium]|nr:protein-glutamate O-methyltransferase CheR [Magnetococcales bacterium]NGZ27458.1 protein-glutamate O-methyltransferase CheR [Magnetococcales bacterium]